ncbi:MAG: Ig-like domain repeat protein [Nitrospirota bacterium]
MKGISKIIFMGLLLTGLNNQLAYSAQDVVKTYNIDGIGAEKFKEYATVIVTANDGITTGGSKKGIGINLQSVATFTFTLDDEDYDGTYTGLFDISTQPMQNETNLQLFNNHRAAIVVDLDNVGDQGTGTIRADYTSPTIPSPGVSVSEKYFSPWVVDGKKDTTLITFKSNENGRYEILIDNNLVPWSLGTHTSVGTLTQNKLVYFNWNGLDENGGSFSEGLHTIKVQVWDEAGNESSVYTCKVWIDNTFPTKIDMYLSDDAFSPGNSPGSKDFTSIFLENNENDPLSYKLSINGMILLGTECYLQTGGTGTGYISADDTASVMWRGLDETGTPFAEGDYIIDLEMTDLAGNSIMLTAKVTIDNTSPSIDSLTNNYGGKPVYRGQEVSFILQVSDWIAGNEVMADGGIGVSTFGMKILNLVGYGEGIYGESYKVTQPDVGTYAYQAYFEDKAGNSAVNTGASFGTISLRGDQYPPTTESRIVRVNVLTPEEGTFTISNFTLGTSSMIIKSDKIKQEDKIKIKTTNGFHVWTASAIKDGEVTVSNTNLFFGLPISNYYNVATSTITEGIWLKGKIKIDDEITINLTAVNILDTLNTPTRTATSMIFEDSRIATGTMIVAYVSGSNDHIWLGTVSRGGAFEISNGNIYSGNLVDDYKSLGEIKGNISYFANGGEAFFDMGFIAQGISLYDNGNYDYQKDVKAGDGIYSNVYTIKKKNDTKSYLYGYYKYAGEEADNNGMSSMEQVEIDATPPDIVNFGAFPGVFRPGKENITIKYTLIEKADVIIEIWDNNNRIRKLTSPIPEYGYNCSAMWDGKNEGGILVKDGDYFFKINAVDKAGNNAVERNGAMKATTIEIGITKLQIIPSIFTPTPNIAGDTDFTTQFHATVNATKEQLQNLGFGMDDYNIYTLPYLLIDIKFSDAEGKELCPIKLPDLSADSDRDPFTNGYPKYYKGNGTITSYGLQPILGTDLPDIGDGNKGNDWDTLVPLQRGTSTQYYYIDWDVSIFDWGIPNGTYIIRVQVKLVGSDWVFIDYLKDEVTKIPIAEMWHQEPDCDMGYRLTSDSVDGTVEVIDSPFIPVDYIAPSIVATTPGANTIHEPTEKITVISAQLMDQGGSQLDLPLSTIILKNFAGMVIAGNQTNNGVDTIYWNLDKELIKPDKYTIEVRPVDRAKNGLKDDPKQISFTILDRVGPKIYDILVNDTALKNNDSFGLNVIKKISVTLSEIETGNSKVDFVDSKIMIESISGTDEPDKLFTGKRSEEISNDNNGRIVYDVTIDKGGTYTIWVEAWDKFTPPNLTPITKIKFNVSSAGYINEEFNYPNGTMTCLSIPPDTIAYATTTGVIVSTNTISIKEGTITKENTGYTPISPVIEFWWFDTGCIPIKLKPSGEHVVTLTMYYGHITLPQGINEDDLAIWRYNRISWIQMSGKGDINKNGKKISVNSPKYLLGSDDVGLDGQYVIMYLTPKPVDVQYNYQGKWWTCLEIPESTTVDGFLVGTNTVTAGTLTETRSGYIVVEPVVQFFLNGNLVTNRMEFTNLVTLVMHYTGDDVNNLTQRGLKEENLSIYEYDGINKVWVKITAGVLDKNNKQITWTTKIVRGKYAIMYLIPEITERPEIFEESIYAYPNPAKGGEVTFRYDLVRDAKVTIKIYTIMGDLVWNREYSSTSAQGEQGSHGDYPSDSNDIIWNCANNAGKKVASGIYIYTLTASDSSGEVTVTKKLIVVQ